jgi:hypothetical protein
MKLNKFKEGAWRDAKQQLPFHDGAYDARLRSGEEEKIEYRAGKWATSGGDVEQWRGLELVGISKTKSARDAVDPYRASISQTHGLAVEASLFLARRAVALNFRGDAYHFYLVANAIDRARLKEVDKKWMEHFASKTRSKVAIEQGKADVFFKRRGGRPTIR